MKRLIASSVFGFCVLAVLSVPLVGSADYTFLGDVTLGGRVTNVESRAAKFFEYNDFRNGPYGDLRILADSEKYHVSAIAENIAYKDQYYKVEGGKWGHFKYSLYFNETPHNISFRNRTFFAGVGGDHLTIPAGVDIDDASTWSRFDYFVRRKDFGGNLDIKLRSPFYVAFGFNRLERDGRQPIATAENGRFGDTVEMPQPVDDSTSRGHIEAGYKSKLLFASLKGEVSNYQNKAELLRFEQVAGSVLTLPADSQHWKVRFAGSLKLPVDSTLGMTAGYSRTTTSTTVPDGATVADPLNVGAFRFSGETATKNLSTSLTSHPAKKLSTKIFFKYYSLEDDSSKLVGDQRLFEYARYDAGAEAAYAFTKAFKADAGYDFRRTNREGRRAARIDINEPKGDGISKTIDNIGHLQFRYNPSEWFGGRLKYEHLWRDSKRPNPVDPAVGISTGFDVRAKDQDSVKVGLDFTPAPMLDASIEYAYKRDVWHKSDLGLKDATRNEAIFDTSYSGKDFKLCGYFDYEHVKREQDQIGFDVSLTDSNYAYGFGVEVPLIPKKLTFQAQYDYELNNGDADFSGPLIQALLATGPVNISAFDDYRRQAVTAKFSYNYRPNLNFLFGYSYQRFTVKDLQFQQYRFVNADARLTGAYRDESFSANVFFLQTRFSF